MCKACGLAVNGVRMNRAQTITFPQLSREGMREYMEKHSFIPTLHNFYTHVSTQSFSVFQSVIYNLYTFYTRLIITKTMYI